MKLQDDNEIIASQCDWYFGLQKNLQYETEAF